MCARRARSRSFEVAESAVETGRDEVRLETGIFDPQSIR
jgi:hypothetical protein